MGQVWLSTAGLGRLASHCRSDRSSGPFLPCCNGPQLQSVQKKGVATGNACLPKSDKTDQMEHQMRQTV